MAPIAAAVAGLLALGVPLAPIAGYGAYFGGCVIVPGVLLLRAAWSSTGNWAEDIGLGAAVGMTYQLLGWALFTAVGLQSWLIVWPLVALAAFAVVPRLRPCWRIAAPAPLPVAWCWGLAICATALIVYTTFATLADHKPPPDGTSYYQDLLYHLSMVHELTRSVPPELPQVAGLRLDYHWLANADMAGAVDITGISPTLVLFRLWVLPQAVIALLVCAALARQVSGVWWTGVLAAVVVLPTTVASLLSPSLTLSVVTSTSAAVLIIDAVFRRTGRQGAWLLAAVLAVVAGGAKPSALPLLLGGIGLAALFVLVRDRKPPWRLIAAGTLVLGALISTLLFIAGSTSGSGFQFLAVAKFESAYGLITGDTSLPGTGGLLPLPLTSGDSAAATGFWIFFGLILLSKGVLLTGFALAGVRLTRRDPVAWFLAGTLVAAWLGMLLLNHPAASEVYFLRNVVPFAAAAASWLVAVAFAGRGLRAPAVVGISAAVLGVVLQLTTKRSAISAADSRPDQLEALARPLLAAAVLALLLVVGWLLIGRLWAGQSGLGVALPVLVVVVASLTGMIRYSYNAFRTDNTYRVASGALSPDQLAAAQWLGEHSSPTDVVLTGSWCVPVLRQPGCDARGWLISGIAGRRTLLEGWAYTEQALATNGVDGKPYRVQPSPWPDRAELTIQILAAPTAQLLEQARGYGVRWIFADPSNGPTSPTLDDFALLRYQAGDIRIYQLEDR
nr:hypothetical protein [Kribbella italica]